MVKVSFSRSAIADLKAIKEYYAEQGVPHIGQEIVTTIVARVEALSRHPEIGRVVPEFSDNSVRELIHPPYRVVYLREITSVSIIRVWRSERLLYLPEL